MATLEVSRSSLEELLGEGYEHYEELVTELNTLVKLRRETILQLEEIANELDKHHKNVNIAKMVGSGVGIVGGVVNVVGLALIPVSLGISAVVAAVGAGVAAAGGSAASAASGAEFLITRNRMKKAEEAIKADKQQVEKVQALWNGFEEISRRIIDKFEESENDEGSFGKKWRSFKKWCSTFTMCGITRAVVFCWDAFSSVKGIVRVGVALYDVGVAILRGLEECAKPGLIASLLIPLVGRTTLQVFDGLFTGIGLILDLATFILTAYDMAKGSHSKAGKKLRDEVISKLQEEEKCWTEVFLAKQSSL